MPNKNKAFIDKIKTINISTGGTKKTPVTKKLEVVGAAPGMLVCDGCGEAEPVIGFRLREVKPNQSEQSFSA